MDIAYKQQNNCDLKKLQNIYIIFCRLENIKNSKKKILYFNKNTIL